MFDSNKSFLKRIEISGFKSIGTNENAQKIDLDNINIIIGANGAGKSNFVSFFKMLNYMMTNNLQTFVSKNGIADDILHFGSKKTPVISAKLFFENENFTNGYDFTLVKSLDTLIFAEEKLVCNDEEYWLSGGQRESYFVSDFLEHNNERALKSILTRCKAYQFHDTSESSHIRSASRIEQGKALLSDGGNIASFLYMLKSSEKFNKYYGRIVKYIQYVIPQFSDFVLQSSIKNSEYVNLEWRQNGEPEYTLGVNHLSDGSIRFIALATLLLQPPELLPNVILIDEPELGLHPQAIDILAAMINIAAENSQIIIATQSARLLDSFGLNQIIVVENDKVSNSSHFKHLNEDEFTDWLEEYSNSQLWEKNILGGQP